MPIIVKDARLFTADSAWGARDIAEIDGATVRLHWTDRPYRWHVNDGAEVFVVLDGLVDMRYRDAGVEKSVRLEPADMFVADAGDEHVAHPVGQARILVIERKGSD
jgi:mannose-6-phosphate isomerase-like protein (cupin superfamily)